MLPKKCVTFFYRLGTPCRLHCVDCKLSQQKKKTVLKNCYISRDFPLDYPVDSTFSTVLTQLIGISS